MLKLPGRLWNRVHRPRVTAHASSASAGGDHTCGVSGQISQASSANCAATSRRPIKSGRVMVPACHASAPAPERSFAIPALGARKVLRQFGIAQQANVLLHSELARVLAYV